MMTPRIANTGEDLVGKVCSCSLGRAGVVVEKKAIDFDGRPVECWAGIGFDGRGLWATGAGKPVIVLAESLADYVAQVQRRPNNLVFGRVAIELR